MSQNDKAIERRIVTGLIVSSQYTRQIRGIWDTSLIESSVARLISGWCIEYYDTYNKAPFLDIEGIYREKLRSGKIRDDLADEIEEDILPELSRDYSKEKFSVDYLVKQTKDYIRSQRIKTFTSNVNSNLETGDIDKAENDILSYSPVSQERAEEVDFRSDLFKERMYAAFNTTYEQVLEYPGALGDILNPHLVRGGFIMFMSISKAGKTFLLLDMGIRAMRQGAHVALFQAGDMTEAQQIMRIASYLTKKPYKKENIGEFWEPVRDCFYNQIDECNLPERECDFGIFNSRKDDYSDYYGWYNKKNLVEAAQKYPDYSPCHNCPMWQHNSWGTAWIKKVKVNDVLTYEEAERSYDKFLSKTKGKFKMATYANGSLSVPMIKSKLDLWEKEDGFTPDIILIDYADLLVSHNFTEFRHRQNDIWSNLRGLSQDRHCLLVTPTQADAKAYEQGLLKRSNFSEDRRKMDHVTAGFGLNHDPSGKEKELGLMRINELVARESYFESHRQVTVLQSLRRGRPVINSFW